MRNDAEIMRRVDAAKERHAAVTLDHEVVDLTIDSQSPERPFITAPSPRQPEAGPSASTAVNGTSDGQGPQYFSALSCPICMTCALLASA